MGRAAAERGAPNPNPNPNPSPSPSPNPNPNPNPNQAPFDVVVGTDLFYAREAMGLLVSRK